MRKFQAGTPKKREKMPPREVASETTQGNALAPLRKTSRPSPALPGKKTKTTEAGFHNRSNL